MRARGVPLGGGFAKLWAANAVSNIGDGVALAAGPLLLASLTNDPALVAGAPVRPATPVADVRAAATFLVAALLVATLRGSVRGRVNSVYFLFAVGGSAIGALAGGLAARGLGITAPFWIAFAGMAALTPAAWRLFTPARLDDPHPVPLAAT